MSPQRVQRPVSTFQSRVIVPTDAGSPLLHPLVGFVVFLHAKHKAKLAVKGITLCFRASSIPRVVSRAGMPVAARCILIVPFSDVQYVDETSVSVLAEINYKGRTRQSWGSASCDKHGHLALQAATRSAMTACLEMYPDLHRQLINRNGAFPGSGYSSSAAGSRAVSAESSYRRLGRDSSSQLPSGTPPNDEGFKAREKELVAAVNQRIEREDQTSRKKLGASFRRIPQDHRAAAAPVRQDRGGRVDTGTGKGGKSTESNDAEADDGRPCVVIVDDEPVNCKMVDVALRRAGMKVTVCNDGSEVVDLMRQVALCV